MKRKRKAKNCRDTELAIQQTQSIYFPNRKKEELLIRMYHNRFIDPKDPIVEVTIKSDLPMFFDSIKMVETNILRWCKQHDLV